MPRLLGAGILTILLSACSPSLAPPPGAWHALPSPPVGLVNPSVASLRDGGVLALAGQTAVPGEFPGAHDAPSPAVEELLGGSWHLRAAEPEALYDSGIVMLPNQDVLVVGGVDNQEQVVQRAYLYDPAADRWSRMPDLPAPRAALFAALLKDGTVLVGGGATHSPYTFAGPNGLTSAWIFDPATDAWRSIASMHVGRLYASATPLPDGTVLIAGGDDQGSPLASAEVFNPTTRSWTVVAPLPQARSQQVATLMPGNVVLMGGTAFDTFGGGFAANPSFDAEIFDIRSRSWSLGSPSGFNIRGPAFAAVAPVAGQRILMLAQPLQEAFAYDVRVDYWSRVTAPPRWETTPTLAPIPRGQVLLLAGKSAWLFDPNGNVPTSDTGLGSETVVLSVIAGLLLLLIGVQAFFRGRRPAAGRGAENVRQSAP